MLNLLVSCLVDNFNHLHTFFSLPRHRPRFLPLPFPCYPLDRKEERGEAEIRGLGGCYNSNDLVGLNLLVVCTR